MAQARLSMRKLREIARLRFEASRTLAEIAAAVGSSRSTVQEALSRLSRAGLEWPWPADADEVEIEARLYVPHAGRKKATEPALPDFVRVHTELARKGVTRRLLWQEYRREHPNGLSYSQFCDRFREWRGTQDVVLRQVHVPGEELYVDYAGLTMPITDRLTGEIAKAQIFVAALGHSSYTFAEATATQNVVDWLGSHVRAFEFFGAVPAAVIPDNLKSGVVRAHRYDPDVNPAYQDLATHYRVSVLPARVRHPRDKAIVESAVQVVERWILAPLREEIFFSLAELNAAIAQRLTVLNAQPFQKREGSRRSVFETVERAALKPLPLHPYQYGTWKKAKVHLDYHIELDRRYYSVPHALIGRTVEARITDHSVEVFLKGRRVAAHARAARKGQFVTDPAHRPDGHLSFIERSHERLLSRAEAIGQATAEVIRAQAGQRLHREQTLRLSLGILRLARDFSPQALEAACTRALELKSACYRTVHTLLRHPPPRIAAPPHMPAIEHENVRGETYFQQALP